MHKLAIQQPLTVWQLQRAICSVLCRYSAPQAHKQLSFSKQPATRTHRQQPVTSPRSSAVSGYNALPPSVPTNGPQRIGSLASSLTSSITA